ncbi:hypothetical protein [Salibacterium qingdaonense]|uniref:Uncharacterized protein n=1 Tax=Salibacterium qingdaonense TaxID=266892 RepID=A0A1I4LPR7_9BACI|nr:hypothetical protein [Salibacterium qingdaonense]SFL92970.1 hypothetical protein SAMN04488054_10892 [Salibacterium qingdaonense]
MKKIEGHAAKVLKNIIHDHESVFEIDGKRYHLTVTEEPETSVKQDVEADPVLKENLSQAKKDINEGRVYTTENVLEMIEQGEL